MNIVLYVNSFLPTVGGKEIVVHYLAKELQNIGHSVRVVGPAGWIRHRKHKPGYSVHRWPTVWKLFREKLSLSQLFLDISLWGGDIIHAHTTYPNGYIAAQIKKKLNIPLIVTPHGRDIHVIPELNFGHRLDPIKRKKISFTLNSADAVTAISKSVESSLLDAGCLPGKIRRIPNGIDLERFSTPKMMNIRHYLNMEHDTRLILSVGNYHPRKGQEVIIKAMPQILKQIPKAKLVLVGHFQESLKELVRNLKLEHSICLTGPIPFYIPTLGNISAGNESADRLASLYSQSDVYVSASINQEAEGLSLAMLDAMAAGLPIVATRISGNIDVVQPEKTGLLVPPADDEKLATAVITVLKQKSRAAFMAENAKKLAGEYHWRKIANSYLETYGETIDKSLFEPKR